MWQSCAVSEQSGGTPPFYRPQAHADLDLGSTEQTHTAKTLDSRQLKIGQGLPQRSAAIASMRLLQAPSTSAGNGD